MEAANAASAQAADQANALADEVNALAEQVDAAYAQYQANLEAAGTQAASVQARTEELQNTIAENQEIVNANQSIIDSTDSGYAGRRADLDAALNVPEAERTEEQIKTISDLQPVFEGPMMLLLPPATKLRQPLTLPTASCRRSAHPHLMWTTPAIPN